MNDELEQLLAELDSADLLPNVEIPYDDDALVGCQSLLCDFFGEKKVLSMKKTLDNESASW